MEQEGVSTMKRRPVTETGGGKPGLFSAPQDGGRAYTAGIVVVLETSGTIGSTDRQEPA